MHEKRLEKALLTSQTCDSVAQKIAIMKSHAIRNIHTLEVYEQVNKLAQFTPKILLALKDYDMAESNEDEATALKHIRQLPDEFLELRKTLEAVYSKTRILNKPDNYILDQDHHSHLANQTRSFDWQFQAEILLIKKLKSKYRVTE
jgi:hexosaminidase